jgi:hypothetical protein
MTVEGIEHWPARSAAGETVLIATLLYHQKRFAVVGLEHQEVIGPIFRNIA